MKLIMIICLLYMMNYSESIELKQLMNKKVLCIQSDSFQTDLCESFENQLKLKINQRLINHDVLEDSIDSSKETKIKMTNESIKKISSRRNKFDQVFLTLEDIDTIKKLTGAEYIILLDFNIFNVHSQKKLIESYKFNSGSTKYPSLGGCYDDDRGKNIQFICNYDDEKKHTFYYQVKYVIKLYNTKLKSSSQYFFKDSYNSKIDFNYEKDQIKNLKTPTKEKFFKDIIIYYEKEFKNNLINKL